MFNKISASTKLTFLVLVLCAFIVGIGVYGISELKVMTHNTQTLYKDRVVPLGQLTTVRYSYAIGILYSAQQANNHQLTSALALQQIQEAEKKINDEWSAYKLTYLTNEETELINQAEPLIAQGTSTINKLKDALNKKDEAGLNTIVNKELSNNVNSIISKLNELVQLQVNVSSELYKSNQAVYSSTSKKFYISIAGSLLFALALAFLIVADNRRLIKNLKASNRKITLSESNFRNAFEYSAMGMLLISVEGKFLRVNKKFIEIIGYSEEELLKMTFGDITHPDDIEEGLSFLKNALEGKITTYTTEKRYIHKNKNFIWVNITSSVVTDAMNHAQYFVTQVEDITEKKESELKFKTLLEKSLVGIYIQTAGRQFQYVNPRMTEIFGYTEQELLENPAQSVIYEEDIPIVIEINRQRFEDNAETTHYEVRGRKKDGTIIWLDIYGSLILHKGEKAVIGNIMDITERKMGANQLKESEEQFRTLAEKSLVGISIIQNGKVIYVNSVYSQIWGYSKEEFMGLPIEQLIYKDDMEHVLEKVRARLSGETDSFRYEARGVRKDGTIRWVEIFGATIMYRSSPALLSSLIDITERKNAERVLAESEEKFRSLVEQSLVGVYILQDNKFVYVNPGFEKTIGYSRDRIINELTFKDLIHEDDLNKVRLNYLSRLSGKKPTDQYTFRAIRNDGAILHIEAIVSRIIYENKPAVIGTLVDITERIEEEKRIGKAVTDAQEKERMQIGMELHDNVKQIMAASLMTLDVVKHSLDDRKLATEAIENIKGYIREAIDELRRLSHQLAPSINTTDTLSEKIEKLVSTMNTSEELHVAVDVDEFKEPINSDIQIAFYRILQEQFNNILKYAKASSVFISIKPDHNNIYLTIKDDGIGFDTEAKKDGIGLENIRRRAHVLGGHVKIISSPGNGCEVNVQIPFR